MGGCDYEAKRFSVGVGGSEAYRENYEKVFGRKEGAAEESLPLCPNCNAPYQPADCALTLCDDNVLHCDKCLPGAQPSPDLNALLKRAAEMLVALEWNGGDEDGDACCPKCGEPAKRPSTLGEHAFNCKLKLLLNDLKQAGIK